MARLRSGEKDQIKGSVHNLIRRHDDTGLWESDIARLTQLDRRRLNNYLNELKKEGKVIWLIIRLLLINTGVCILLCQRWRPVTRCFAGQPNF